MEYLLLLAAILYTRSSAQTLGSKGRRLARRWFDRFFGDPEESPAGTVHFYLALLIPVVIIVSVPAAMSVLHLPWLTYLVIFAILLYAFDRSEREAKVAHFMSDLSRRDIQGAYHDAEGFVSNSERIEDWPELHESTLAALSYDSFQRYFPVIFWFVVVGTPGALLYGMLCQITSERVDTPLAKRSRLLLTVLEWLPVRLLGFTYSLVGNWETTFPVWRESLTAFNASIDSTLMEYTHGALQSSIPSDNAELELSEIHAIGRLVDRCLIIWLAVIGILVVLA